MRRRRDASSRPLRRSTCMPQARRAPSLTRAAAVPRRAVAAGARARSDTGRRRGRSRADSVTCTGAGCAAGKSTAAVPVARSMARAWPCGSTPRSKRWLASVSRPSAARARNGLGREVRDLEQARRVVSALIAVRCAAHDAGEPDRPVARRRSAACPASSVDLLAVEQRQLLARARHAHADAALELARDRRRAWAGRARASRSW